MKNVYIHIKIELVICCHQIFKFIVIKSIVILSWFISSASSHACERCTESGIAWFKFCILAHTWVFILFGFIFKYAYTLGISPNPIIGSFLGGYYCLGFFITSNCWLFGFLNNMSLRSSSGSFYLLTFHPLRWVQLWSKRPRWR